MGPGGNSSVLFAPPGRTWAPGVNRLGSARTLGRTYTRQFETCTLLRTRHSSTQGLRGSQATTTTEPTSGRSYKVTRPSWCPTVWHGVMYPCKPAGTHGHCGPQGELDQFYSHPLDQHPRGHQGEPDSVLFAPPGPAPTRADRARQQKLNPARRDLLSNSTFDMCAFAWDMRLHVIQDTSSHLASQFKGPERTRQQVARKDVSTYHRTKRTLNTRALHTHARIHANTHARMRARIHV